MIRLGLIDEYHLVMRPYILGGGQPFFHATRPPLRPISSERIDENTAHLVYVPA